MKIVMGLMYYWIARGMIEVDILHSSLLQVPYRSRGCCRFDLQRLTKGLIIGGGIAAAFY